MSGDDYLRRNRDYWNGQAAWYAERASDSWTQAEPDWGIWSIPEREVGMLRSVVPGMRVLEDGCGTGYVSAWMARRGAWVVGLDNSPAQLATAWRLRREHGLSIDLVHGAGEALPFADASFDFVISEYGAAIWADPHRWIPEASRVLRPGGELVFLKNSLLLMLCMPDHDADLPVKGELVRDQRGLHRLDWPDDASSEFHLSHGDYFQLFHRTGFDVEDLIELYPPADATTRYAFVTLEWARRWPSEEVWRVRKRKV
jgi:SAM-dependent methyltransferase